MERTLIILKPDAVQRNLCGEIITRFERKRYRNLSHAPSKAMNLNSYIGLLGRSFKEHVTADGCHLVECAAGEHRE